MPRYVLWKMKKYISVAFNRDHLYYPWPTNRRGPSFIVVVYLCIPLQKTFWKSLYIECIVIWKPSSNETEFLEEMSPTRGTGWVVNHMIIDIEPECDDINVTQRKRRRADVQGILSLRTDCLIVERAPYTSVHDPWHSSSRNFFLEWKMPDWD